MRVALTSSDLTRPHHRDIDILTCMCLARSSKVLKVFSPVTKRTDLGADCLDSDLPLSRCVTLGKLPNGPSFPDLYIGDFNCASRDYGEDTKNKYTESA